MKPITIGVFTFNHEHFVESALESIFSQDADGLEIIISDDASTDNTQALIQDFIGRTGTRHKIVYDPNATNLGLTGNVNKVFEMATNDVILVAAGDDISRPMRARKTARVMEDETVMAMSFGFNRFTGRRPQLPSEHRELGKIEIMKPTDFFRVPNLHTPGCSRAYRKSTFTQFGPLRSDCPTEDSTLMLRALLLGSIAHVQDVEVDYRIHGENLSGGREKGNIERDIINEQYLQDIEKALSLNIVLQSERDCFVKAVKQREVLKQLDVEFAQSKYSSRFLLTRILTSAKLPLRQKYKFIRNYIRRKTGAGPQTN